MVDELARDTSGQQHRWRAWIMNTQSSAQLGSHWFTVVVGAAVETPAQLLQSTASSSIAQNMGKNMLRVCSDRAESSPAATMRSIDGKTADVDLNAIETEINKL